MRLKVLCFLSVSIFVSGCDESSISGDVSERIAYQQQLEQCRKELSGSNLIPIIGGGYVDISRFGFGNPSVVYKDGECGMDMLEVDFWWTGKEAFPNHPEIIRLKGVGGQSWSHFKVVAKLGNQRKGRLCRQDPDLPQCEVFKAGIRPGLRATEWPGGRVVKLKNYPGLELWLKEPPPNIENQYSVTSFVMVDWRRQDGTPRDINCWGLGGSKLAKSQGIDAVGLALMSEEELSNIDFRGKLKFGSICEVDFGSFSFEGGSGSVVTTTNGLPDAQKALRAISEYISNSIIKDDGR